MAPGLADESGKRGIRSDGEVRTDDPSEFRRLQDGLENLSRFFGTQLDGSQRLPLTAPSDDRYLRCAQVAYPVDLAEG
jgi:hypothetical protein